MKAETSTIRFETDLSTVEQVTASGGISDACDLLARDMFDPEDDHEQPRRFRICLYHRDMRARCGACETCGWHRDGVRGAACQCGGGE
jgi:hypothetical protein